MSRRDDLLAEPWRFDLLGTLRLIERSRRGRPRIGDSARRAQDYVGLGERPFLDFPPSTIEAAILRGEGGTFQERRIDLFVRFLGLLGPQGPLPLHVTDEAFGWQLAGDAAYPRFLDILNHRFLQLFFRAWADARPIAQADRPLEDRFLDYIGSAIGIGSPVLRGQDTVSDRPRLGFAGLLAPKAKSASRLSQAVEGLFGIRCEVEEFVGTFLTFEVPDRNRLGEAYCSLGVDFLVGASVYSVEDKIRLCLYASSLAEYQMFLPSGPACTPLADFLYSYLGSELDCDVELALRNRDVVPFELKPKKKPSDGKTSDGETSDEKPSGRKPWDGPPSDWQPSDGPLLGYTTWLTKPPPADASSPGASPPGGDDNHPDTYHRHARFNPAERAKRPPDPFPSAARPGDRDGRDHS